MERGMQHNQKIVFRGEADEAVRMWLASALALVCATADSHARTAQPDTIPGDIIFVIQQKEHPVFKRKGMHAAPCLSFLMSAAPHA